MKLLQITALALLLHTPFSYTMNDACVPALLGTIPAAGSTAMLSLTAFVGAYNKYQEGQRCQAGACATFGVLGLLTTGLALNAGTHLCDQLSKQ